MSSDPSSTGVWPTLTLRDPDAMIGWLAAIGFVENAMYRDEAGVLVHGELLWPAGGGLMLGCRARQPALAGAGRARRDVPRHRRRRRRLRRRHPGAARAPSSGRRTATRAAAPRSRDPEGNLWSFGSYAPSAQPAARAADPATPPPSTPQAD